MIQTNTGLPAPLPTHQPHTPWARSAIVAVILSAFVAVIVATFLWPAFTSTARNLPLAVVGAPAQTSVVESGIDSASPHTFAFTTVSDRAKAVALIRQRTVYGAVVLGTPIEVLTASAANTSVAQAIDGLGAKLQAGRLAAAAARQLPASAVGSVAVTDVVPLATTDPRGLTLGGASFPLVLGGILGGVLVAVLVVGVWRRLIALGIYVVVASVAITAVMQGWFGSLQGDFFVNAGAIALMLAGIGGVMLGMASLVGRFGIVVGPVLFILIANPISAANLPVEFLPVPWGVVGQLFPPGAGATLLRELSYFPRSDMLGPWLVLAAWAALGLILSLFGHLRNAGAVSRAAELEAEAAELRFESGR